MIKIEKMEQNSVTYDKYNHLVGRTIYFATFGSSPNVPIMCGRFVAWYSLQDILERVEFDRCKIPQGITKETFEKEVLKEFEKKTFLETTQQLINNLKEDLTKRKLTFIELDSYNEHKNYRIPTSWGDIEIGMNKNSIVHTFFLDGVDPVSIKGVFDWEETFFERVRLQLRLRHLFKEKEA